MTHFAVTVDISRARDALGRIPAEVERAVEVQLALGAEEVARDAKRNAPKLYSTLANSIRAERVGALHYRVSTGMNYARGVEEGTGPAAGKARYYPNPESLLQYLQMSPQMRRFEWKRKGSLMRDLQEAVLPLRAKQMAWAIYMKGTKARPFMQPAAEANRSRLFELVALGVDEGLKGAMA